MKHEKEGKPVLHRETVKTSREAHGVLSSDYFTERAKVPGGWLVISQFHVGSAHGMVLLPDPSHSWDGGSLA